MVLAAIGIFLRIIPKVPPCEEDCGGIGVSSGKLYHLFSLGYLHADSYLAHFSFGHLPEIKGCKKTIDGIGTVSALPQFPSLQTVGKIPYSGRYEWPRVKDSIY